MAARVIRAAISAAVIVLIVSTHTFVDFDAIRVKVVRSPIPSSGSSLGIGVSEAALRGLRTPFAAISRIRNSGSVAATFALAADGEGVCQSTLPPMSARRVDCAVAVLDSSRTVHQFTVSGPPGGWSLEYLELATHHGGTTGAHEVIVLPSSSTHFVRPGWIRMILAWLMLSALLLMDSQRIKAPWLRVAYRSVSGVLITLTVVCVISQWVSPYRLVISSTTIAAWILVLLAPRAWRVGRWVLAGEARAPSRLAYIGRAALIATMVSAAFAGVMARQLHELYDGNYSGFLQISRAQFDRNPLLNERADIRASLRLLSGGGYDGQFMYFAAFDPFLRAFRDTPVKYRDVMDAAPYRFGRVGFSVMTRALSVGRWQLFPKLMLWLILAGLWILAFAIAAAASARGLSPAIGLLVLAVPGFWQSLQTGLPEPVAAAALVTGMFCVWRGRWPTAAVLLGVSLLVRETGVVAVACALAGVAKRGNRVPALVVGGIAIGALVLWRIYVGWVLFPDWGSQGFLFHPPDLGWPVAGFVDLWRYIARGEYYAGAPALARAGVAYPILLSLALLLSLVLVATKATAVSVAAAVYGGIAVCLNFDAIWVHVGNGQRGTYEVFLMLMLCTLAIHEYQPRVRQAIVLFWVLAATYVFFLSFDASYIRTTLPLPL